MNRRSFLATLAGAAAAAKALVGKPELTKALAPIPPIDPPLCITHSPEWLALGQIVTVTGMSPETNGRWIVIGRTFDGEGTVLSRWSC